MGNYFGSSREISIEPLGLGFYWNGEQQIVRV
ncbi:hypothetical protein P872_10345 [Rhodonellum psychrophilum GCM71 = DSM 17998]|uniref:Uncharacterized protein n=1 Tax=Rhodonellum psychrophilum GCM71 = DSM 17998 TaxID=1123057 RepID=U5BVD2_9BACT|nr:hypothetical protein P872_10345 [Rhodonellum psychrophilum GCM71 = DSM 17998]